MKYLTPTISLLSLTMFLLIACGGTQCPEPAKEPTQPATEQSGLPASLDDLYPPRSKEPVLFLKMMELTMAFDGIVVNLTGDDPENAKASFERLKTVYAELAEMIPEWEALYPAAPVEALGEALASGDQGRTMGAVDGLGGVCAGCHARNLVPVQFKYYWTDFRELTVTDPLTNQELPYDRFKLSLSGALNGIMIDLQEGQPEPARKNFEAFKARFGALEQSCDDCHTTERKYYVDQSVKQTIDELGQALAEPTADPAKIGDLSMAIGKTSCFGCHAIHAPATLSKHAP